MTSDSNQSAILRLAVENAVAYLQRLPKVPTTSAVIKELEDALARATDSATRRSAATHTPTGELLVNVVLRHDDLLLTTELRRSRSDVLWQALSGTGLLLRLQPGADSLPSKPRGLDR